MEIVCISTSEETAVDFIFLKNETFVYYSVRENPKLRLFNSRKPPTRQIRYRKDSGKPFFGTPNSWEVTMMSNQSRLFTYLIGEIVH